MPLVPPFLANALRSSSACVPPLSVSCLLFSIAWSLACSASACALDVLPFTFPSAYIPLASLSAAISASRLYPPAALYAASTRACPPDWTLKFVGVLSPMNSPVVWLNLSGAYIIPGRDESLVYCPKEAVLIFCCRALGGFTLCCAWTSSSPSQLGSAIFYLLLTCLRRDSNTRRVFLTCVERDCTVSSILVIMLVYLQEA